MRTEPDLSRNRLLDVLRDRYQADVVRLTFVPYGIDSWSYLAACRDGSQLFVKLSRPNPASVATPSEVPLLAGLAARGLAVPSPVADRDGGFVNAVDGFEAQALEYIEGASLEHETAWPDDLYSQVAEIVAAVHASTGAVGHLVGRVERYELPFLLPFVETLTLIEAGGPLTTGDDAAARLREMVAPRARDLRLAIGRLEELRDLASARDSEEVLCHTDIWGSNLLRSDDGTLHLLDWDGALLGPPEQDLFMFAGTGFFPSDRFGWFLDRYETAFRRVRLHAETFGFYLYRRNLEDLASFVDSIVTGRIEAMSPDATLAVVADLLSEVPRLDGRIRHAAGVLSTAHPAAT